MAAAGVVDSLRDGYKDVRDAATVCLKKLHSEGFLVQHTGAFVEQLDAMSGGAGKDLGSLLNSGCRGDPRVSAMSVLRMIGKHHVEVLAGFTPKLEQLAGSEDPSVSFISKELLGLINRTQAAPREGAGAEGACNESSSV
eukprot:TRINITY_DN13238_c0_g1_i1.p1 TRINITY_DN13238_c0_g1~~TRINITY_DN13238_c0_g1_i1.p1  ORF type:complete len:140 (-),score=26.65 TRINITY_DN13238_c0_g1_i1:183-602(-)